MRRPNPIHRHPTALALLGGLLLPLLWSLWGAMGAGLDAKAWVALAQAPNTVAALATSVWTGLASTLLAIAATAWILVTTVGQLA